MTNLNKPLRPIRLGLTSLFLMALLSGCGTTKTLTVTVKEYPPEYLTQDCPVPASTAKNTGELIKDIGELRGAIRTCNVDKAALREWAKVDKPPDK